MKKLLAVLLTSALMLTVLAGCGSKPVAASSDAGAAPAEGKVKIGVSLATLQFPFYQDMQQGLREAAGDEFELAFVDCNGDEQNQMNSIENFIQMGCTAVVMTYQNYDTLENLCAPLTKAGIPIILCDAGPTEFVYQAIGTDNRTGGRTAGKWVAETYLKDIDKAKALEIILLATPAGTSPKARVDGFAEEILKVFPNANIQTLGKSAERQDFMSITEDALSANANIDLIFGYSAQAGMGAYDAVVASKKTGTKVIGYDATAEEMTEIDKAEDSPYLASVVQNPKKMGELAIQTIRDYVLAKKELPADQKYVDAGVGLYTYGGKVIPASEIGVEK